MTDDATDAAHEFCSLSWHDNALYRLRLDVGDPTVDDRHADLVLDIDHIVEWMHRRRRVVSRGPATLVFHDVTDLRVTIDCGDTGYQMVVSELSIDRVTRHRLEGQKICPDRPYYRWRIALNLPVGGELSFGASGFSQVLRAEPLLLDQQKLPTGDRVWPARRRATTGDHPRPVIPSRPGRTTVTTASGEHVHEHPRSSRS